MTSVRVIRSIRELDRQIWTQLTKACDASVFYSWEFLTAVEAWPLTALAEPFYLLIEDSFGDLRHVVYAGTVRTGRAVPFAHFLATFYAVCQHVSAADTDEIDYGIGPGAGKALRGCHPALMSGHTHGLGARAERTPETGRAVTP